MTDLTDQILNERNPHYFPLSPSYENLTLYADELDYEGNQITFEWANNEILTHRMGWVMLGLVAERMRRYRLYKDKYEDWKAYCRQCLGKENWQVNKIIEAAKVTLEIIRYGCDIYPTSQSHAQKLIDCCKKTGVHFLKAWEIVSERLPDQSLVTARSVGEVLGFPAEENSKINIDKKLRDRLTKKAIDDGMTIEEKIAEMLDMEDGIYPEDNADEDDHDSPEQLTKEELWHQDLKNLIEEHDREIWLLTSIAKLIHQGKREIKRICSPVQLQLQI